MTKIADLVSAAEAVNALYCDNDFELHKGDLVIEFVKLKDALDALPLAELLDAAWEFLEEYRKFQELTPGVMTEMTTAYARAAELYRQWKEKSE
jgi:hypothetical protein